MTAATTTSRPAMDRALVDRLAERANTTERLRRLPDETVDEARSSGLFDLLLPARYGGQQGCTTATPTAGRSCRHWR